MSLSGENAGTGQTVNFVGVVASGPRLPCDRKKCRAPRCFAQGRTELPNSYCDGLPSSSLRLWDDVANDGESWLSEVGHRPRPSDPETRTRDAFRLDRIRNVRTLIEVYTRSVSRTPGDAQP